MAMTNWSRDWSLPIHLNLSKGGSILGNFGGINLLADRVYKSSLWSSEDWDKDRKMAATLWLSQLRIWRCHCCGSGYSCGSGYNCGMDSISGSETSACHRCSQKKKKKVRRWRLHKIFVLWDEGHVGKGMVNKSIEKFKEPLIKLPAIIFGLPVTFGITFRFFMHNLQGPPVWSLQFPL